MRSLRRIGRRVKGWFWSFVYFWRDLVKWIGYQKDMRSLGLSEAYIREAFSYLAQLDIGEWVTIHGFPVNSDLEHVEMKAWGNEVHVRHLNGYGDEAHRIYEFVLKEGWGGRLYCHVWNELQREVKMEFGTTFKTNWWEVYRSGRHANREGTIRLYNYLRQLYGDGPNKGTKHAIQE